MHVRFTHTTDRIPSLMLGIYTCVTSVTTFYLAVFFKENLGFSASQIGLLYSIQAVTGILAAFPTGIGNDWINSRTLVIASLMLQSISLILMGIIVSYGCYAGIFFIWALSTWMFRQSLDTQFLKTANTPASYESESRGVGSRIGYYQAWRFIGATIGIVGSGYGIAAFDFRLTLISAGVICLFLILPSVCLTPTPMSKVRLSDYKADFSNRNVILFAVWMMLFATHWGAEQTCYGLFLRDNLNLPMNQMGWYMGAEFAAIIVTVILAGNRIYSREAARFIAIIGLATSGIGHIGMVIESVWVSVSFRALHGIGDGCIFIIFYYGISKLFSTEHLGGNSGLINFSSMVGYIAGSMTYSPVGEHFGYEHPLWISGVVTLLLALPLLSVRFRQSGSVGLEKI